MIELLYPGIPQLECTRCIMGDKRQVLYTAARRAEVEWIVMERDTPDVEGFSGLNPSEMKEDLEAAGYRADVIDFSCGLEKAVMSAGDLFQREKEAARVMKRYHKEFDEAVQARPKDLGLRVAVFLGITHPVTNEHFLVQSFEETMLGNQILTPMGCTDVTPPMDEETGPTVLQNLSCLKEIEPDVIVFSGNAHVGLRMLHQDLAQDESMRKIPAVRDHAIFGLPHISGGEPLDLPASIVQWSDTLKRAAETC